MKTSALLCVAGLPRRHVLGLTLKTVSQPTIRVRNSPYDDLQSLHTSLPGPRGVLITPSLLFLTLLRFTFYHERRPPQDDAKTREDNPRGRGYIGDSFRGDDVSTSDEPIVFVCGLQKVPFCFFCWCVRENIDIMQPLATLKPMTRIVVVVLMRIKNNAYYYTYKIIHGNIKKTHGFVILFYIYFHHSCTGMHYHSRNTT